MTATIRTLFIFTLSLLPGLAEAGSGDRIALVVGIDNYERLPAEAQLNVAVEDAELMAATLESLEPAFDVTLLRNASRKEFGEAIIEFVAEASRAECVLIYFAGHGIEFHGENYLLTKDSHTDVEVVDILLGKEGLSRSAISLNRLLELVEKAGANITVAILDACRDNPFASAAASPLKPGESGSGRDISMAGLGHVTAPSGMVISYAADAGQAANDGLFTGILAKHMKVPGRSIMQVFAATRSDVREISESMEADRRGVMHEPAEYCKLDLEGLEFSFQPKSIIDDSKKTMKGLFEKAKEKLEEKKEEVAPKTGGLLDKMLAPVVKAAGPKEPVEERERFRNSLGMEFLELRDGVSLCLHETRVSDYVVYLKAHEKEAKDAFRSENARRLNRRDDYPVSGILMENAEAFCAWLSKKEGRKYRLPTSAEWSEAAGVGLSGSLLLGASMSSDDMYDLSGHPLYGSLYPWGGEMPPGQMTENLRGEEFPEGTNVIEGYRDEHPEVAQVKFYPVGPTGYYDLGGNVSEMVTNPVSIRGASWDRRGGGTYNGTFNAAYRRRWRPDFTKHDAGFRIVLETAEQVTDHASVVGEEALNGNKAGDVVEVAGESMIWCPPTGEDGFYFGYPPGSRVKVSRNYTQRRVELENGFWLARTECTQGLWEKITGQNITDLYRVSQERDRWPGELTGAGDTHPVYFLRMSQVVDFLIELNRDYPLPDGWIWALPTKEQWEYACYADESKNPRRSMFPRGDELYGHAHYDFYDDLSETYKKRYYREHGEYPSRPNSTAEVGRYPPNEWGFHDMIGNVKELCAGDGRIWTSDGKPEWYHGGLRGGSFQDDKSGCCPYLGSGGRGENQTYRNGFRLAIVKRPMLFTEGVE